MEKFKINDCKITVDLKTCIHKMYSGIGASWHAIEEPIQGHGGSAWGGNPSPEDEKAWQCIYDHAAWLGLSFIRVELEQRMYQPQQDTFTFDGYEMKVLYRILDWCEANKVDVLLQQMWSNVSWNAHDELQGHPNTVLKSSPKDIQAFAKGIASLLEYLTKEKGFNCIKWFCMTNEPGHDWSWYQGENMKPVPITPALKMIFNELTNRKIPVALAGPDWTDLPELDESIIDFDQYLQAYEVHSYNANFDWREDGFSSTDWPKGGYPLRVALKRIKAWIDFAYRRGKPFFLGEMGSMQFGWGDDHPGPGSFEAGLKDVQTLIRGMNIGVDGFNRWSFINRGNLDGQWQLLDTWDKANNKMLDVFSPHPNVYYLFGMISRFTPKGAYIYKTYLKGGFDGTYQRVFAVCNGNEKLTNIFITNDSAQDIRLEIELPSSSRWYEYKITEEAHANTASLVISPSAVQFDSQTILEKKSLLLYSTAYLKHNESLFNFVRRIK